MVLTIIPSPSNFLLKRVWISFLNPHHLIKLLSRTGNARWWYLSWLTKSCWLSMDLLLTKNLLQRLLHLFFLGINLLCLLLSIDLSCSTSDSWRRKLGFLDPCPLLETSNTWHGLIRSNESVKTNGRAPGFSTSFKYQGTPTMSILACGWRPYTSGKARLTRSTCLVGCWHPLFSMWRWSPAFLPRGNLRSNPFNGEHFHVWSGQPSELYRIPPQQGLCRSEWRGSHSLPYLGLPYYVLCPGSL